MTRSHITIGSNLRIIFWIIGVLTFLVGLTMFFLPGPAGVGSGGSAQAPVGDQWWPWPLRTELNTRFLGALFTGVGIGAFWSARQQLWQEVRGLFPAGLTFTGLATIAAFLSRGSFNNERLATWIFFGLYIVVFITGIIAFVQYERKR